MSKNNQTITRSTINKARVDLVMLNTIISRLDDELKRVVLNSVERVMFQQQDEIFNNSVYNIFVNTLSYYNILK